MNFNLYEIHDVYILYHTNYRWEEPAWTPVKSTIEYWTKLDMLLVLDVVETPNNLRKKRSYTHTHTLE